MPSTCRSGGATGGWQPDIDGTQRPPGWLRPVGAAATREDFPMTDPDTPTEQEEMEEVQEEAAEEREEEGGYQ